VAYLLPDALDDLPHLQAAFDRFKDRCPPILMSDLMLFEPIGSMTQRECQPRGQCASSDAPDAGSECSVLIYYSHNSHSLFNYS